MKTRLLFLLIFSSLIVSAQENKANQLLKELSNDACNCIDSINTRNKTKEQLAAEIAKCIDARVITLQLSSKLRAIDLGKETNNGKEKKASVNISINTNKSSDEYKKYYYQLERYLMDSCKAIKSCVSANDIENEKSVSKNQDALEWYSKGLKEYNAENYNGAITLFQQAVIADSTFAFAWDNLGICYRKINDFDNAIVAYKRSLAIDPKGLMPLQNIAVAYRYKKEYKNAIDAYMRLSEIDQNNPEVYYGLGETYTFYVNDIEKGLDNMCKAYNLYVAHSSPYRTDAEKIISSIYNEMKKQNKLERFNEILKANHINPVQ